MCVNMFELPKARGNSHIFIYDQSSAERELSIHVKVVDGVSDLVNQPSCKGNKLYKLIVRKQRQTNSTLHELPIKINPVSG